MDIIDTDRYPIDRPDSAEFRDLCAQCQAELEAQGLFNLPGFLRPEAIERALDWVKPVIATEAFVHKRVHNIYLERRFPASQQLIQPCEGLKPPITQSVPIKSRAAP